ANTLWHHKICKDSQEFQDLDLASSVTHFLQKLHCFDRGHSKDHEVTDMGRMDSQRAVCGCRQCRSWKADWIDRIWNDVGSHRG
ncbi:hypothetical protein LEMLEM_LOCUS7376, partial [Lemmus lemmus]